jgi:hypothetical protein
MCTQGGKVLQAKKLSMAKQYFASQGQIRTAKSCATHAEQL